MPAVQLLKQPGLAARLPGDGFAEAFEEFGLGVAYRVAKRNDDFDDLLLQLGVLSPKGHELAFEFFADYRGGIDSVELTLVN